MSLPPVETTESSLGRQATLTGTIVDAVTGHPVVAAYVYGDATDGGVVDSRGASALSQEDGRFTIGIADGAALRVLARSYLPLVHHVDSAHRSSHLTLKLERGSPISGSVIDAERGEPIEGALVWAARRRVRIGWPIDTSMLPSGREASGDFATTDALGRFSLTGVDAGFVHEVVCSKPGYFRTTVLPPLVKSPNDAVVLRLSRLTVLKITVFGDDGEDVSGFASLDITPPRGYRDVTAEGIYPVELPPISLADQGHTLLFIGGATQVGDGEFRIEAACEGYAPKSVEVPIPASRVVTARVLLPSILRVRRADLAVRVLLPDGKPLDGRWLLELSDSEGHVSTAPIMTVHGVATVRAPVGRCAVRVVRGIDGRTEGVHSPSEPRALIVAEGTDNHVDLVLSAGVVRLHVHYGGQLVRGYDLQVAGKSRGTWHRRWDVQASNDPGTIVASLGRLEIRVSLPDVGGGVFAFDVETGGPKEVHLELEAGKAVDFHGILEAHRESNVRSR
jgi:hypothetical protein